MLHRVLSAADYITRNQSKITQLQQRKYITGVCAGVGVGAWGGGNVFDGDPAHYRGPAHFRDAGI